MFPLISKASANDTLPLIIEHLTNMEANLKYYFLSQLILKNMIGFEIHL